MQSRECDPPKRFNCITKQVPKPIAATKTEPKLAAQDPTVAGLGLGGGMPSLWNRSLHPPNLRCHDTVGWTFIQVVVMF